MTRMTGPDCAVMCNSINSHTHVVSIIDRHRPSRRVEGILVRTRDGPRPVPRHVDAPRDFLFYFLRTRGLATNTLNVKNNNNNSNNNLGRINASVI